MSRYRIEFDRRVKKDLRSISAKEIQRIKMAIAKLAENPRPFGCKKLKGENNEYFRIRVGNYRVIYTVEDNVLLIVIIRVGHRQEIYDNL
ncbi:type II toxin-antitoxin system RelE/ParE family toxin [Pleurocapsa sp. PCC 7319]|uniref:type II toxin-antitoxin system RelE family toxin n=1 Tax=Pleurocapsa sp. PCC 7319 TaxID=118161 RepID=UPI00034627E4|nr:type II toxin-antitoxin system RelE/ParE family toxin [Pleurocapsa sp. PCC 7319]